MMYHPAARAANKALYILQIATPFALPHARVEHGRNNPERIRRSDVINIDIQSKLVIALIAM